MFSRCLLAELTVPDIYEEEFDDDDAIFEFQRKMLEQDRTNHLKGIEHWASSISHAGEYISQAATQIGRF